MFLYSLSLFPFDAFFLLEEGDAKRKKATKKENVEKGVSLVATSDRRSRRLRVTFLSQKGNPKNLKRLLRGVGQNFPRVYSVELSEPSLDKLLILLIST